jgi:hypothetical protein
MLPKVEVKLLEMEGMKTRDFVFFSNSNSWKSWNYVFLNFSLFFVKNKSQNFWIEKMFFIFFLSFLRVNKD